MATRGRPRHDNIHPVSYYTPKAELALKAQQKVLEGRLRAAYTKLFTLAYDKPDQRDMHHVLNAVREGLKLI